MHIPDGFLAASVWAPAWGVSIAGLAICLRKASKVLKDRMVPLMGVMASFIFAAQMLNFPVIGGTSGHLLGGVLAAILLGPYAGAIVLSCVLVIQCLIFQDGGFLALGANIFNMAIVGTMGGYYIYKIMKSVFKNIKVATAVSAYISILLTACVCSYELAFSGIVPLPVVLSAMFGVYALIGIGEALITMMVIEFVFKVRPDLIYDSSKTH